MGKWWIVPLIMIVGIILGLIGGAWSQRPIVEYSFVNYPDQFDFEGGSMSIEFEVKNTGNTYAKLNLVIITRYANISVEKIEPWMEYNITQLKIHADLPSHMETYNYYSMDIKPVNNPQNFTLQYSIENKADLSIPNGIIGKFLEPHGYMTQLIYNRTDTTVYELIP